jgi:hypothetical protein
MKSIIFWRLFVGRTKNLIIVPIVSRLTSRDPPSVPNERRRLQFRRRRKQQQHPATRIRSIHENDTKPSVHDDDHDEQYGTV